MNMKHRIIDATPLITLFIFLLLGFIGKEMVEVCMACIFTNSFNANNSWSKEIKN